MTCDPPRNGEDLIQNRGPISCIAALTTFGADGRLPEIRARTLALGAADDMLVPSNCSKHLAEGIKGARLAMTQWGGHAGNVTDPDGFNARVLQFRGS